MARYQNLRDAIVDWALGYDVFVSYAWLDGATYPEALAHDLRSDGRFRVFLDRTEYHAGLDLRRSTVRKVRASTVLLLVLQPAATQSSWVYREVEAAIAAGRMIIVLDVDSCFDSIPKDNSLRALLENRLRIHERSGGIDNAPSPHVLTEVQRAFRFRRKETITIQVVSAIAGILAVLTVVASWQYILADRSAKAAGIAQKEAESQRNVAIARQTAAQAELVLRDDPTQLELAGLLTAYSMQRATSLQNTTTAYQVLTLLPRSQKQFNIGGQWPLALISKDLKYVALRRYDGTLSIVNMERKEVASVPIANVSAMILVPGDQGVIVGTQDGRVLISSFSQEPPKLLASLEGEVSALAADRAGRLIAASTASAARATTLSMSTAGLAAARQHEVPGIASPNTPPKGASAVSGSVSVIQVDSGEILASVKTGGRIRTMAFGAEASILAFGGEGGTVSLFDLTTKTISLNHTVGGIVGAIAFSADGTYLAAGTVDAYKAEIIRTLDGSVTTRVIDSGTIDQIVFSPIEPTAYIGSVSGNLRAVDATNGSQRWQVQGDGVWALAVSPDGETVAAGFGSRAGLSNVRVLNAGTGAEIARQGFPQHSVAIAFSASGFSVASVSFDGTIAAFDPFSTTYVTRLPFGARFVEVGASGRYIALASTKQSRVIDATTGKDVLSLTPNRGSISRLALSPDENLIAFGDADGMVTMYELAGRTQVWSMREEGFVDSLAFSSDSGRLLTASKGVLTIRDATSGKGGLRIPYVGMLEAFALSPDGRYIALGEIDRLRGAGVRLVEIATQTEIARVPCDMGMVIRFSSDGKYLAFGSFDRSLHVINTATRKVQWTRWHQSYIWSVAFSPDARHILAGDHDGSARLRDVATGVELSRTADRGPVRGAAILHSRAEYVTVSGAGEQDESLWVSRRPYGKENVIAALCERITRPLTQDERQFYLGEGAAYESDCGAHGNKNVAARPDSRR